MSSVTHLNVVPNLYDFVPLNTKDVKQNGHAGLFSQNKSYSLLNRADSLQKGQNAPWYLYDLYIIFCVETKQ